MKEHPINQLLNVSLDNVVRMIDTQKIVGEPIQLPENRMIIPISRVTFGFGAGGSEFEHKDKKRTTIFMSETGEEIFPFGGGSGGGVSIAPMAFLVIDSGKINVLYTERSNTVYDKIFDFLSQFNSEKK